MSSRFYEECKLGTPTIDTAVASGKVYEKGDLSSEGNEKIGFLFYVSKIEKGKDFEIDLYGYNEGDTTQTMTGLVWKVIHADDTFGLYHSSICVEVIPSQEFQFYKLSVTNPSSESVTMACWPWAKPIHKGAPDTLHNETGDGTRFTGVLMDASTPNWD